MTAAERQRRHRQEAKARALAAALQELKRLGKIRPPPFPVIASRRTIVAHQSGTLIRNLLSPDAAAALKAIHDDGWLFDLQRDRPDHIARVIVARIPVDRFWRIVMLALAAYKELDGPGS